MRNKGNQRSIASPPPNPDIAQLLDGVISKQKLIYIRVLNRSQRVLHELVQALLDASPMLGAFACVLVPSYFTAALWLELLVLWALFIIAFVVMLCKPRNVLYRLPLIFVVALGVGSIGAWLW